MLRIVVDENVAVDRRKTQIEPGRVELLERSLRPVADSQTRKQHAALGFQTTVCHIEAALVTLDLRSPESSGAEMGRGLAEQGTAVLPCNQIGRYIVVEPRCLGRGGRTRHVIKSIAFVNERIGQAHRVAGRRSQRVVVDRLLARRAGRPCKRKAAEASRRIYRHAFSAHRFHRLHRPGPISMRAEERGKRPGI